MPNMQQHKTPVGELAPMVRNRTFDEVTLTYTPEEAMNEAARCLQCKHAPCVGGCPVSVYIPTFIGKVAEGDFAGAYAVLKETNALPAVCGRVCPQERQCEEKCVRGIKGEPVAIGRLERFVSDTALASSAADAVMPKGNGKRVAIVGSGPAGLSCAGDLSLLGYDVTIFEALHIPGGVLSYGIPAFRLPKNIVKQEIDALVRRGVKLVPNFVVGKTLLVEELFSEEGFSAVFIGSGAGLPSFLGIPGENLNGVYSANEYLTRVNLMKAYETGAETPVMQAKKVCVIGGGNVAMDAARCAMRLGAEEVSIVYRRGEEEMPARQEEIHHAKEEGILFKTLTNPIAVCGDEKHRVTGLSCVSMALLQPDESGRRRPAEIPGSDFFVECDCVIMSIGTSPNPLIKATTAGLETNRHGCIVTDEQGKTSLPYVYAGGDVSTGAATVILAMGAGKAAAKDIHRVLSEDEV